MAFKGTATRDCQRINLDAETPGRPGQRAHRQGPQRLPHRRPGARCRSLRAPAGRHRAARQLPRRRAGARAPGDPARVRRGRGRCAVGGLPPVRQALLRQPPAGAAGDRPAPPHRALHARRAAGLRAAPVQRAPTPWWRVAGDVDPEAIVRAVEAAFGAMPRGSENRVAAPAWLGGLRTRALAGSPQTHVVLGFPLPSLGGAHQAGVVAAALLGEGMSSPLMDQLRERRGLVYYAACSADVLELAGQFVIEASTSPQQLPEFFAEVVRLLLAQAQHIDTAALQRARRQIAVRHLRELERPGASAGKRRARPVCAGPRALARRNVALAAGCQRRAGARLLCSDAAFGRGHRCGGQAAAWPRRPGANAGRTAAADTDLSVALTPIRRRASKSVGQFTAHCCRLRCASC